MKVLRLRVGGLLFGGVHIHQKRRVSHGGRDSPHLSKAYQPLWPLLPIAALLFSCHVRSQCKRIVRSKSQNTEMANEIMCRFALLAAVAACRGVFWLIEQPKSSLMPTAPRVRWLQQLSHTLSTHNFIFHALLAALACLPACHGQL